MRECSFELDGVTLKGKRWGEEGKLPVIALHGWLDNCASFDFLAPLLNDVDLVTIDLAGQGQSDHRSHSGAYNIWLDIMEIIMLADQLKWEKFALLGHSRGGMIATLTAGTFPDRVSHLALIESFAPQFVEAKEAPIQMAAAINALIGIRDKNRSEFNSFDDAVKAREQGFLKLVHQDALVLAKRGVIEREGKYMWNNDIKLNAPSEIKFTLEQARAFTDRITIPIELIIAKDGLMEDFPQAKSFIDETQNIKIHYLSGDHHLHMSHQCQQVADIYNDYFSR
ncbi:alpha/beta hydrolase [Agarilytica rhodophyticola]|uniref:alpha/beta hydrolase n=1 Tax=Agarilytica rhodophyticola TaxID=1737490 RepID=UPI001315A0A8|nr:alpha/beta hydrolase [Agarilytica rhodophyticola]